MIGLFLGALVKSLGDEIKLPCKRLPAHSKLAETLVAQSIASAFSVSPKNGKEDLQRLISCKLLRRLAKQNRLPYSVSASLSMWDKLACKSGTHAGSSTVWSTAFSPTARCPRTRPSAEETIPSTRSSARLALASMCPEQCLSTLSPPS